MDFNYIENPKSSAVLIFLHGWLCESEDFKALVHYFKKNYSILTFDCTGLVLSSQKSYLKNDDTFQYVVSEITSSINKLKIKNLVFIGHSLGGVLALSLSEHLKSITLGLIIIDTSLFTTYDKAFFERLSSGFKTGEKVIREFIEGMNSKHYDNAKINQLKLDSMIKHFAAAPELFINLLENAVKFDKRKILSCLDFPTMYIAREDTNLDLQLLKIISSKIDIIRIKSGHFIMLHAANRLNSQIDKFLNNYLN